MGPARRRPLSVPVTGVTDLVGDDVVLDAALFLRLAPGLVDRDVYVCASPGTTSAVRSALHRAGLPEQQLHEERFAF